MHTYSQHKICSGEVLVLHEVKAINNMSGVRGAKSLENEPFRDLKRQLRRLNAGATHASVLQALANMCREEEVIADRQTYVRKRGVKKEESVAHESFWKRRFIISSSESRDDVGSDTNLFTKYVKRKCRPTENAKEKKVTTFSTNVQELLLAMTTRFAGDINEAYVSDPSQIMARGESNAVDTSLKICQVESNMKSIDEDMRKLAEAKSKGDIAPSNGFTGFSRLGENDCLVDEESFESASSNSSNSSDDSEESGSQSASGSDDSEDSSEWDSDDESSLDSNFMAEMANELGFDICDRENDVTVDAVDISFVNATANIQEVISDPPRSQLLGLGETASYEKQLMHKEDSISSGDTAIRSLSHGSPTFGAGGTDEREFEHYSKRDCDESNSNVSENVNNISSIEVEKCTSSLQIQLKPGDALRATELCDAIVVASPFKSSSQEGVLFLSLSARHASKASNSAVPLAGSDDDDDNSGEDCSIDDSDASDKEGAVSNDELPVSIANSACSVTTIHNEPCGSNFSTPVVSTSRNVPAPVLPLGHARAEMIPELASLCSITQAGFGLPLSRRRQCSSSMPGAVVSAVALALDIASLSARGPTAGNCESGSGSDDDSDNDSEGDSENDSEDDSERDSDGDSQDDSDLDDNYLTQFESSLCAAPVSAQNSSIVQPPCENVPDLSYPSASPTHVMPQGSPLPSATDVTEQLAVDKPHSGIGSNVGCFNAMGKPNKKAAICCQIQRVSSDNCDYQSDLCIAARLAATVDENVAPFALTEVISRRELCENVVCTGESKDGGDGGETLQTPLNGHNVKDRSLSLSKGNCAAVKGALLVDWNTTNDVLLVTWGDPYESDSCASDDMLVGWGDDAKSNSDDDELDGKEVVSDWTSLHPWCDENEGGALNWPGSESLSQPCHTVRVASAVSSDGEFDLANRGIQRLEFCVESNDQAIPRDSTSISLCINKTPTCSIPTTEAVSSVLREGAIGKRLTKSANRRGHAVGRRVSFRDAFKNCGLNEVGVCEQEGGTNENACDEAVLEVVFPRIDFQVDRKRTRRLKRGEVDSLSTRRRRKLRENEIKSAMVDEKVYIEGLCMLNKSRGNSIACKIKSQI